MAAYRLMTAQRLSFNNYQPNEHQISAIWGLSCQKQLWHPPNGMGPLETSPLSNRVHSDRWLRTILHTSTKQLACFF